MAKSRVEYHDDELINGLRNATQAGFSAAVQLLHSEMKQAVNVPNTGERRRGKDGQYKPTIYPNPSAPGEPPRKRTGFGQRQIVREIDAKNRKARVGVTANGLYMFYLDQGTKHIARRPWIIATLLKVRTRLIQILKATRLKT